MKILVDLTDNADFCWNTQGRYFFIFFMDIRRKDFISDKILYR